MCKLIKLGGFNFRDIHLVNLDLLGKWRLWLISGSLDIRREIHSTIYGVALTSYILDGRVGSLCLVSFWWMRVTLLGSKYEDPSYWFMDGLHFKVEYVFLTSF